MFKPSFLRQTVLCLSLVFPFSTLLLAAKSDTLQIKGSDTMVNLGQAWAEEYMTLYPDRTVAVTGGGSGTGIAAIIAGTCDIAQSSRSMTSEEKAKAGGQKVNETPVAYDGIAVIVHPSNPISQLTIEQISDIFTGKIKNWSGVGGEDKEILVTSRERNSGTHVFFLEHVLRKGHAKGPEEFGDFVLMMPSSQAIVEEVKNSDVAIGYVGLGYVNPEVKVLKVSQSLEGPFVQPSIETIHNKTYEVSRPLFFYTKENHPNVADFIQFVLSPDGQEIVKVLDFVPLEQS